MENIDPCPKGLREIHKECLRLAAHHYTSKEIARKLGISKHTVDQRLRHATQQLGATSRYDAARRFVMLESETSASLYDPIIYNAPYLPAGHTDASNGMPASERDPLSGTDASRLQDAQAPYAFGDASQLDALFSQTVSSGGAESRQLSASIKSLLAAAIAAVSLLAFGAAVAALEVLSRI